MLKVCVIGVYFGKFPNYFNLWLKSCETNPTVDFFVVTDNVVINLPSNVQIIKMSLQEMKKLAEKKIGMSISLDTPYKCCDYKPVYGLIFEDYIQGYDYWGHCDFDLLFGDLRYFFQKYHIEKYDKFLPLGHLAFYRNTEECNQRFRIEPKSGNSYKKSFSVPYTTQFDELGGINAIYNENKFDFFKKRVFVDVSINWDRIKCAEGYKDPYDASLSSQDKNYKYQLFAWTNGKVKRFYFDKNILNEEEFAYIHIKKRKYEDFKTELKDPCTIYICPHRFVAAKAEDVVNRKTIQKYNHYYGCLYELLERKIIRKIRSRIHI